MSVILLAGPAFAGEDEIDDFAELDLEELLNINVYTAAKHEQDIAESASAISVITREQIENTHCTDVVCLLRQLPEVDVMMVRPLYAAVGARALSDALGDKALVLVDGLEINHEVMGMVYWQSLPVHLEEIDRIEVIRGPGSALYGANAHSLVVSISTRRMENEIAEIFLGGGEHDRSSIHLRVGQKFGKFRLSLSGGADTGGHWRIRDQRERELGRLRLQVVHQGESSTSTFLAGFSMPEGGLYSSLAPVWAKNIFIGHLLLGHETEALKAQLSFNVFDGDTIWDIPIYFGEVKLGEPPEKVSFFSSSLDADVQFTWTPFENNLWIGGCNYRWIAFLSDENDPEATHQHRLGLFMHNEQRLLEELVLTLGVRFDYNSITPFTISPRLALVWKFADRQYLRLAAAQAFRKPSFFNTSMHMKGFTGEPGFDGLAEFFRRSLGNEDLNNESITTLEAGYRGYFFDKHLHAEAVAFYNRYRNIISIFIDMVTDEFGMPDLADSTFRFENMGREVDTLGGSISLNYQATRALRLHANYTFRHSWFVTDHPEESFMGVGHRKGDRVAWEAAHLFNFWFHYLFERGLRVGMAVHARSASEFPRQEHGGLFDEMVSIPRKAICLVSGFVSWQVRWGGSRLEVGVRAFNILDEGFRDNSAVMRRDGTEIGGELIGRMIFVFLRGAI
ncbi:TonB-dependent receptor plug domain-containing protein [Myxococcota bacterium]